MRSESPKFADSEPKAGSVSAMPEPLDLGPCAALRHEGDPDRWAVLLPGQFYPTRAPVLWFAREAVMAQGWSALEVLGEPGQHTNPFAWVRDCAQRALAETGGARTMVIGKSLASLLAEEVSDRGHAAVWLTPLLTEQGVTDALARTEQPTLLIGGTADGLWQRDAIPENPAIEVLELDGFDHSLQRPGDSHANLDALLKLSDAVGRLASQ
jgi:pimeloyl-ACP methyl ester carboxylesterase